MIDHNFYSCTSNNQIVKWFYCLELYCFPFTAAWYEGENVFARCFFTAAHNILLHFHSRDYKCWTRYKLSNSRLIEAWFLIKQLKFFSANNSISFKQLRRWIIVVVVREVIRLIAISTPSTFIDIHFVFRAREREEARRMILSSYKDSGQT